MDLRFVLFENNLKSVLLLRITNSFFQAYENNANGKLLANFCGYSTPDPAFATTNIVYVVSRKKVDPSGYSAGSVDMYYLASKQGVGCGGDLFNYGGIFSSPNYPNNDRSFADCRWNISVPQNFRVALKFKVFDLGSNSTCETNFVEIIEVSREGEDRVVRTYCGEEKPDVYSAERSVLSVRFKKTVNFAGTGFIAEFFGIDLGSFMLSLIKNLVIRF